MVEDIPGKVAHVTNNGSTVADFEPKRTFVVGIGGPIGSGKSRLIEVIKSMLTERGIDTASTSTDELNANRSKG